MNRLNQRQTIGSPRRAGLKGPTVAGVTLLIAASLATAHAAEASMKIIRKEGGISPNPVVTGISKSANGGLQLQWQAFTRQVAKDSKVTFQVVKCPALKGTNTTWTTVATVTNATSITTDIEGDAAFLTIQQTPAPEYAGADKCALCHIDTHDNWLTTAHAGALESLKNIKMDKNTSCLPCHTVGFGTENGYKDEATTPQLAGVQCENCHGPAGAHARNPLDKRLRPVKSLAAEVCGGCHTDAHHPTYDEWATSAHGTTQIPEEEFSDPTSGPPRMLTCGACHSAATRVAMLTEVQNMQDYNITDFSQFDPEMPTTTEASETGITCVACHNPHLKTDNGAQLRFPLASKIPYSYTTATNFAANFNPEVQTCAQCHNMRGANWTGTSRPPHHSPQYNMLIGNGGYEAGATNLVQSGHMDIPTQCTHCHTHPHSPPSVTEASPAYMGHDFKPTAEACAPCHDFEGFGVAIGGELLKEVIQTDTKKQIGEVKALLDQWALTKAPDDLRQKYGVVSWEFQNIGQLSTRTPEVPKGPTAAEQKAVPDAIKQARHNLYLVEHDASYGVHNGKYARFLLKVARDLVNGELSK